MNDNGSFSIKFTVDGLAHSSEDAGDGIWSAFTRCDALYDSKKGETIVIDEPELSLHPSLQKKMLSLLLDQAREKQLVISTHSPYFVSWPALLNGAILWRTAKSAAQGIEAFQLEISVAS